MEFRDLATTEASGLVSRLLARSSDQTRTELKTFRKALDAAVQAAEKALGESTRAGNADDVAGFVERLTAAAAAHVKSATDSAKKEAQVAIDAVRADLATYVAAKENLTGEKDKLAAERDKLAAEKEKVTAEKEKLTAEKNRLSSEHDKASATLKTERAQADSLKAELGKSQAALRDEAQAKASLQRELQETTASLEATRTESTRVATQLKAAAAENAKATAALSAAQDQIRAVEEQHKATEARLEANAARAAVESQAALDRVLESFQSFSSAMTVDDVLAALARGLAKEFTRVAVFVVNGNRLEAEQQLGFDDDMSKVVMPVTIDSLPTRALTSGALERLTASELADGGRAPFGGAPSCAVAFPVQVEGKAVAVLYADDAGESRTESAPADVERRATFAQLLRQHAVLILVPLARDLKVLAELRQYATTLVNEIEYMYQADVAGGKNDGALQASLMDNVDCARRIYAQRIESEAPTAAGLIEEQLSALMQARTATPFGRDLARIAGRREAAPAQHASRQAEAS
jgi:hypothetical protein